MPQRWNLSDTSPACGQTATICNSKGPAYNFIKCFMQVTSQLESAESQSKGGIGISPRLPERMNLSSSLLVSTRKPHPGLWNLLCFGKLDIPKQGAPSCCASPWIPMFKLLEIASLTPFTFLTTHRLDIFRSTCNGLSGVSAFPAFLQTAQGRHRHCWTRLPRRARCHQIHLVHSLQLVQREGSVQPCGSGIQASAGAKLNKREGNESSIWYKSLL